LKKDARYLHISIPYDKDEDGGLITFDDGLMTELECDEDFTPPMLNKDDQRLEVVIDLKERKVQDWNSEDGYHLNQQEMIWLFQRLLVKYDLTTKDITKEIMC